MRNLIHYSSDGQPNNIPWLFIDKEINVVKYVIYKIKFPTGFSSNINNILTKKGEFGGVKTHDWHTFIKVFW
jgi:hypothetical protein